LIRVFLKATDLQKAVTRQIVKARDPVYIKTLRDRSTNTILVSVSMVLAYLFTTYGETDPEGLRERKLKVRGLTYELMEPLVVIYDEIKELERLGVVVVKP